MSTLWNLPVLRLIATDRCRVAAPWFSWSRGDDPASVLRRHANAVERRKLGADHPFEQALALLLYVALAPLRASLALRRWGRGLRAAYAIPYYRQCIHLCTCTLGLGLRPEVYYYLRLHQLRRPAAWSHVIDPAELHHLQRDISPPDVATLADKLKFTRHAQQHGLPAVPLIAVWEDGRLVSEHPDDATLCRGLFVKRARSYGSIGVMAFRYNPITGAHHDDRRRYTLAELASTLASASRGTTLLVQPKLENHPELAGFSAEALCNYRLVTGRHPDGRIEVLSAALRFPLRSTLTCAEPNLTLCAAIDRDTGRLHAAEAKQPELGRLEVHPTTHQPIAGWPVPRWPEICALARRAHAAWPEFPFIGWDVSDTSEGLFLLEGGCLWGGYLAQMSGNPPLGSSSFAGIYTAHLSRRPAAVSS